MTKRFLAYFLLCIAPAIAACAQMHDAAFSIEQAMAPAFPYGLVAAKNADRIAWMEDERGMRNVYTAAGPEFHRTRVSSSMKDDAVDLQSVELSDDGLVVIFVRGSTPNRQGQYANQGSDATGGHHQIWAAAADGSAPAWLVVDVPPPGVASGGYRAAGGGARGAPDIVLSPDGKSVLYVVDGQVYCAFVSHHGADAAAARKAPPLFTALGVNSDPVWSPDGRKIAFVTARYDQRQYFPTQGKVTTHSFIAVYDLDHHSISYMAPGVDQDTSPIWSPDGKQIAFLRRPGLPFGHFATTPLHSIKRGDVPHGFLDATFRGGYTLGLWVVDVATHTGKQIWHDAPGDKVFTQVNHLDWIGDRIVFRAEENTWPRMYSISASGGAVDPVMLTPGEGEVEHATFSPDGKWLYFTSNVGDQDRRHLWRVPLAGGQPEQLTKGALIETVLAIPGSGKYVVAIQSGPQEPVSIAVFEQQGGRGRVIGPPIPPMFPIAKLVTPQSVEITAADGVVSHAILFLPADEKPGEKHPALLYLHGNGGRLVLGFPDQSNGYYQSNYELIQYFVNKGYIVAAMNYRGDGALYNVPYNERRDYGANGVSEYRDVLAAGLYLKNRSDVDPERLGVWGLSYGGWLTGEALSRNSDLFKAGAIFAGVQLRSISLDPQELAYQSSPAFNVTKWTSPTLFLQGDDDRNVEFSQTIGMIDALRATKTLYKVFVMPDETHYMLRFATRMEAFEEVDDWFDTMLLHKTNRP